MATVYTTGHAISPTLLFMSAPRIAYLYSRYPVVSQTFCDSEMLELGRQGVSLVAASIYPPKDSFRHERLNDLSAPVVHQPGSAVLKQLEAEAKADGYWPGEMIARHDAMYGKEFKAAIRARNALYFARKFEQLGVRHFHVHFANRATHTALFLKAISGITFSFTPHAQDFMVDLGSDDLLREMCAEAEFVVAVSEFSRGLLQETCPDSAEKICRVYNGLDPAGFLRAVPGEGWATGDPLRIVSVGRLIEFKGFHHLIEAVFLLKRSGVPVRCRIIGEGPWHDRLSDHIKRLDLGDEVELLGRRSQVEVHEQLLDSDVFALPCIIDEKGASDILPTVITEAMACGLPVVSTHLVGVPEMVDDGDTGFLVDPGNPEALAGALGRVFRKPEIALHLGRTGRQKVERAFALEVTAGQLREKFSSILEGSGASVDRPLWVLVDRMPEDSPETGEAMCRQEVEWLASRDDVLLLGSEPTVELPDGLAGYAGKSLDFLPDGIVLEMEWRARGEWRQKLENLRNDLHQAVDGETFFLHARRATWIAQQMQRSGGARLHALRSESALTAWLVWQLTGTPFSIAIEEGPAWSTKLWQRMSNDACAVSVADEKLATKLGGGLDDNLLQALPEITIKRFGPFRSKKEGLAPPPAKRRAALYEFLGLNGGE